MTHQQPSVFDPEGSILFLGSGFSADAKNLKSEPIPTGRQLRQIFARIIAVDPDAYDLPTLAGEISQRPEHDLYSILYDTFTTQGISEDQKEILRLPWLRIYTTNYDDVVEYSHHQQQRYVHSYTYNEPKPRKLHNSSVVHLHGAIRKTSPENVNEQLILNEHSYVRQHFEHSPWYDEFIRDVRFSTHCFFIGYSLSDYHVSALLLQQQSTRDKTFFVNRQPDQIFENRVRPYGSVLPIDLKQFVELLRDLPRPNRLDSPYKLKSFRFIDPFKDKKTLSPPTAIEVLNLVTYGVFNEKRCLSSLPNPTYVVPRHELTEMATNAVAKARTLLVHSRLGNGKSIFLSILAHRLSEQGFNCFWCHDLSPLIQQEARALSDLDNVVILFDSYNVAVDAIAMILDILPAAKFVVSIRTGIQEVRFHEIPKKLPAPIERINANGLSESERTDFVKLLDEAGILARGMRREIQRSDDIREVVVTIYRNTKIREKLESELRPILDDRGVRTIVIASHLLKWIGQDADSAFLRAVTGRDAYAEASRFRETVSDFFLFGDDELAVHSALFAEFLIDQIFDTEDIVDVSYNIVVEAVKRKRERRYQAIMGRMMQVSTLKRLVKNSTTKDALLESLFDRLHRDIEVNKEPLFWLQYSILMMDLRDFGAAENFLSTAYARADENPGFQTFQIDTHSLRLLFQLEQTEESTTAVDRFEEILGKLDLVISMTNEESHRRYAFRVLNEIEPFVRKRLVALSTTERNALLVQIDRLIRILGVLIECEDVVTDGKETLASVERAKAILLKG